MAVYSSAHNAFDIGWFFSEEYNRVRPNDYVIARIFISEDEWVFKAREMFYGPERFEMSVWHLIMDNIDEKVEFNQINLQFPGSLSKSERHRLHLCSKKGKVQCNSENYPIVGGNGETERRITMSISKLYINELFEKNKVDYDVIKERMDPLKKELMEYCYHPTRIDLASLCLED